MKVMIIGGGASGMMAALTASKGHEVILIERQSRMGRKLLATGNGRCNLTNRNLTPANYHGEAPEFCRFGRVRIVRQGLIQRVIAATVKRIAF